jgi:rRNA biogenesis protein RRP5
LHSFRHLFERVLTTKLSQKKAKSTFKKWMDVERRLGLPGDESGAELVKAKAIAYVQRTAGAAGGGGADGAGDEMEED